MSHLATEFDEPPFFKNFTTKNGVEKTGSIDEAMKFKFNELFIADGLAKILNKL